LNALGERLAQVLMIAVLLILLMGCAGAMDPGGGGGPPPFDYSNWYKLFLTFCMAAGTQFNVQGVLQLMFQNDPTVHEMFHGYDTGKSFIQGFRAVVGMMGGNVHLDGHRGSLSVCRSVGLSVCRLTA
jgi:hypothetical protein